MGPKYRADIDGLRAVAVLAVVLYHAFPALLPGGFVGVDVFFVISGFLITSILLAENDAGRFSFAHFYARRIRRLFPALGVVLFACLVAGWFLLFQDEYRQLGKHTFAGSGFGANILLWRETGYFDTAAESKPLLHLWSLGIEEQFYFAWPMLLALLFWRGVRILPWVIALAVGSFALNLHLTGTPSAFYLPFPRFWELLSGAALATLATRGGSKLLATARSASWVGLALLIAGVALINRSTAFPGFWVVLPVAGTALLIAAGPEGAINRHLLSQRWLVGIGLISYPLYLWHWPLLAFARTFYSGAPPTVVLIALVAASFALAYGTYRWIEKPLRSTRASARVPIALCAAIALVAGLGLLIVRKGGLPHRYGAEAADLVYDHRAFGYVPCDRALGSREPELEYCFQSARSAPTHAVFGDSHGDHIFAGLAATDASTSWLMVGHPSCPPVIGVNFRIDVDRCQLRSEHALEYLLAAPAMHTVVLAYYSGYTQDTDYALDHVLMRNGPTAVRITPASSDSKHDSLLHGLELTIGSLEALGEQVVIVEDVPELPFLPRACVRRTSLLAPAREACEITRASVLERQREPRQLIAELAQAHHRLLVFDPLDTLCNATTCPVERDGRLLYRDSHHLTAWGSAQVARALLQSLRAHAR